MIASHGARLAAQQMSSKYAIQTMTLFTPALPLMAMHHCLLGCTYNARIISFLPEIGHSTPQILIKFFTRHNTCGGHSSQSQALQSSAADTRRLGCLCCKMTTLVQMVKSGITRFQIPFQRIWKHGKVRFLYNIFIIALAILTRYASLPLHQQTLYWEEPSNEPLQDHITEVKAVKNEPRISDLDKDYAMPPSASVNNAWSSLLPKEGGFFEHPAITSSASWFCCVPSSPLPRCVAPSTVRALPRHQRLSANTSHFTSHLNHDGAHSTMDADSSYDIFHVGHYLMTENLEPNSGGGTGLGLSTDVLSGKN
ncbi:uncharacterized protein CLUP02_12008 [Colletotrichum lupini]|uniref:Uncharacterized protein n=1 Tax=Colletotrichum lupini TaxID=145971 RepID=A0A9Q8T1F6_9PEZI|nr:uncharacterized protein CLUP02_12008 [Colletotrichum lupini]UQC86507.1 hypothetical protein CLUP02_12008 [Colletotrichum lupini]